MKLTNYTRQSIVRKILADVPKRNFQHEAECLVLPAAVERLPAKVRSLWNDSATRAFVRTCRIGTNCGALYVYVPSDVGGGYMGEAERVAAIGEEAWAAFQALCAENRKAKDGLRALEQQLTANLASVSTRKVFIDRFPELAKYAPAEREQTANLPATNDLMVSLRSAGLPVEQAAA